MSKIRKKTTSKTTTKSTTISKTTSKSKTTLKSKTTSKSKGLKTRIIIKDNFGGLSSDKDSIKAIIESIGGTVEVIVTNEIKKKLFVQKFKKVDLQIFIEHVFLEYPLSTFPAKKSYIFINQEYISDWDIEQIKSGVIIPLCKTKASMQTLAKLGVKTLQFVGFGNNKKFEYIDKIEKLPNLFIHIVGASPLKGTQTVIATWLTKNINETLIITGYNQSGGNTKLFNYWKLLKPKLKDLPEPVLKKWAEWKELTNTTTHMPQFENKGSVYFYNITMLDINVIRFLQSVADVHLCPSLIEGWGQYIDEGRRAKSVVVTMDAPPMNELIKDNETGILVKAYNGPKMRELLPYGWSQYFSTSIFYNKFLYGTFKTTPNDLYHTINRILSMTPEQKRHLGENAFKQSSADYDEFKNNFIELI